MKTTLVLLTTVVLGFSTFSVKAADDLYIPDLANVIICNAADENENFRVNQISILNLVKTDLDAKDDERFRSFSLFDVQVKNNDKFPVSSIKMRLNTKMLDAKDTTDVVYKAERISKSFSGDEVKNSMIVRIDLQNPERSDKMKANLYRGTLSGIRLNKEINNGDPVALVCHSTLLDEYKELADAANEMVSPAAK